MKRSADEETVKQKMKSTFQFRRNLIEDPDRCCNVLAEFPLFKDVKGLIEQDFVELFGEATSNKFKERWPTAFKEKIIAQSKGLHRTSEIQDLINSADTSDYDGTVTCLESSSSCIYSPSAQGRKRP